MEVNSPPYLGWAFVGTRCGPWWQCQQGCPWGVEVKRQHQGQEARGHLCERGWWLLEAGTQAGKAERVSRLWYKV